MNAEQLTLPELDGKLGPKRRLLPNIELLNLCFTYSRETGVLTWKERPVSHFKTNQAWMQWNYAYAGTAAGCPTRDKRGNVRCLVVGLNRKSYRVHAIIMEMEGISIPDGFCIDHRNRNPADNRFENLRVVKPLQNCWNMNQPKRPLPTGVYPFRDKLISWFSNNNKRIYVGVFTDPMEASAACILKKQQLRGEYYEHTA